MCDQVFFFLKPKKLETYSVRFNKKCKGNKRENNKTILKISKYDIKLNLLRKVYLSQLVIRKSWSYQRKS